MGLGHLIAICTTIVVTTAGVATIISTIRYMKSENSKVLKEQSQILVQQSQILVKIEEGQRKGFEILEKSFLKISEILAKGL